MKNKITRNGLTAIKQLSGNWRVQLRIGDRRQSVTAPTWDQAIDKAMELKMRGEREEANNLLLGEAIEQYIAMREPVVSPATIRTYNSYTRNWLQDLTTLPIQTLDKKILQLLVNKMVLEGKSVKYMRSLIAFVTSVYNDTLEQNKTFKINYPQSIKKVHYLPTEDDLKVLMAHLDKHDQVVLKAVVISLVTNFRIGQVCALRGKDLDRDNCLIGSYTAFVRGNDGWVEKAPKTDVSARFVKVPERVFDIIGPVDPKEFVIGENPHNLSDRFVKAVKRAGLKHFVFHDLRHFNASLYHKMAIPAQYAIERGGWADVAVMNSVYTQTFNEESMKYNQMVNDEYIKILGQ